MSIHLPEEITSGHTIKPESIHELGNALFMIAENANGKSLLILAPTARMLPEGFAGETTQLANKVLLRCPCSAANAAALRRHFPWTKPGNLRKSRTAICVKGLTAADGTGWINAVRNFQISPFLTMQAEQNPAHAGQTLQQAVDDALFQVFETNFRSGWGAGAGALKNMENVDSALEAGMTMFSLDLSGSINTDAAEWDENTVNAAFDSIDDPIRTRIDAEYADQTFVNGDCGIFIDRTTARRCALLYSEAIDFISKCHHHLTKRRGEDFDLELSLAATAAATPPEQHFFLVRELRRKNITISSLALRFANGPVDQDGQFHSHAQIARVNGDYKITLPAEGAMRTVLPVVSRETDRRLLLILADGRDAVDPVPLEKNIIDLLTLLDIPKN